MLVQLLAGCGLAALTVAIHAAGLALLLKRLEAHGELLLLRFWMTTWLVIRVTWFLILTHLLAISVWAVFYRAVGCLPDLESSLYFSGVTYSTVGYGDVVLPEGWRILGPIEGLTGILMCGLSTGVFLTLISRLYQDWIKALDQSV